MNKAYRLVWSRRHDCFVAVPEIACARGKSNAQVCAAVLVLASLFTTPAGAQVDPATGRTTVTTAAGGVPVVGIATANGAGVSHNQYNRFNVDTQGLVLNNNASAAAVASQLAGTIAKNANLIDPAKLILNEVISSNRSTLKGYMEVAGTRADVVVANPWGITCNGCGFINTDHATLSTGVPVWGSGGSLDGLRVNQGDILINGTGLKGGSTNILDIVARSVTVDGAVAGNDLQFVAGSNDYSYTSRTATPLAASGGAPTYAIDSTALGGMYAQRISIIATENGVGVRTLGDVAVRGSDFTLSAAGNIELRSKSIAAANNVTVSNSNTNAQTTTAASTAIEAGGKFTLNGGALDNQGRIVGAQGYQIDVTGLANGSTTNSSARIASTLDDSAGVYGSSISSSGNVSNYGAIHARGDLAISAQNIANQNTGGVSSRRELRLTAANAIDNRGALYAGGRGLALQAATINNFTGGTIEAVASIWSNSLIFNNYSVIRADSIGIDTEKSFFNGLETPVTPVLDLSTTVASSENEAVRQIDFWQEDKTCARCDERWLYQDAVTYREKYSAALPAVKPQILALDTLVLDYGNGSATNYAGVLSGDLVSITGTGKFTNQDVALAEITYYRRAADDKEDHWHWLYGSKHMYLAATTATPLTNAALSASELKALRASSAANGSVAAALAKSALFEKSRLIYTSAGAGVYANTLYTSAGQVENLGSPLGFSDARLAEGGFTFALPTNPNGHYVPNADPKSRYRVVTNPDFEDVAASADGYELEKLLGYNPDDELLRLGDISYEDYLIEQQMVAQGAASALVGNEAAMINRLRANAVDEFRSQKLVYGTELTPEQIKNLGHDIVWMVKTTVGGKTVLAPRVYLSQATRAMLMRGAVLAAKDTATIDAAAVTNTGGTIAGGANLAVRTTGDITNTGGKMTGGDVALVAQGKVVNETTTQGSGNTRTFKTTLGKTGQIEATSGNLSINAGQQITTHGAEVRAAKDISLTAVGAITVDNIVDKTTTSTSVSTPIKGKKSKANTKKFENKTTTSEQVVGGKVAAGGQLNITSGADVTVKGSTTTAGGGVAIQSRGDVKVIAEQNKTASQSVAKQSGRGVGGGLWGKKTQTTNATTSTNAGSTVAAGGDTSVQSGGELKLQGSQLKAAGNADLKADKGINVLAGTNESTSSTVTKTTTFLKIGKGKDAEEPAKKPATKDAAPGKTVVKTGPGLASASTEVKTGDAQANAKANAKAEAKQVAGDVGAKAEAGAEANSKHDIKLFESTKTTQTSSETQSVGSAIAVGGNLNASTGKTLKVEGSTVNSGQAMNLNAGNVVVEAGTNTSQASTQTSSTSLGLFEESKAKASAQAQAGARGGGAGAAANASASAKASADTTVTIGLKKENGSQSASSTTHTDATLASGGDMKVTAKDDARFAGAKVDSGGSLDVKATNITNNAVQNTTTSTSSKETHLAGMYYSAEASAGASANAGGAGIGAGAQAGAKAEAKAEVSKGLRYQNTQETETKSTTTQQTNSFSAQNDITRTAGNEIKDQGTQLTAGGNIKQSAQKITDQAVSNTTSSSKSSQTHDARLGVVAGASAEVGGSVSATVLGTGDSKPVKAEANAGVGVRAGYVGATGSSKDEKSTAVTSSYKAGNDISTTSSGNTSLQGTRMEAGKDVNIQAGSLDVGAAKDASSSSSNKNDINAQVNVTVLGTAGVDTKGGYKGKIENATSSADQVGSIKAGGNVAVNSGGDANFTGTQIQSEGKTAVNAQGDVNFKAAQSSSQSSTQDIKAKAGVKAGAGSASGSVDGGYARGDRSSSAGEGAKVDAKGGIDVNSGGNVSLQGTALKTAGDANVAAKGTVKLEETTKRETGNSLAVGGGIKGKHTSSAGNGSGSSDKGGAGRGGPESASGSSGSSGSSGGAGGSGGASSDAPGASSGSAARTGSGGDPAAKSPKAKPSTSGGNLGWSRTDKTESTTTSVEAGGKVNIKGATVVNQEAKVSGSQVKVEGKQEELKKTQKSSASGVEINAGMQTK